MKRTIKFRGKSTINNEWVFGYFSMYQNPIGSLISFINTIEGKQYAVRNNTISQYTGYTDKNGKEIYEGDIIRRVLDFDGLDIHEDINIYVHWSEHGFTFRDITKGRNIDFCLGDCRFVEVIGNIHDNNLKDFGNEQI